MLGVEPKESSPPSLPLPPISASAFPAPEDLPVPSVDEIRESDILTAVEPVDSDEVTRVSDEANPTDTAKRRTPARTEELRDDSVPKPPKPKVTATPEPAPASVGGRNTLPPPAGYDEIRKTAGRIAYVLENSPKPPLTESARLRIAPAPAATSAANRHHEQSPSSPSLDVSATGFRKDFTATRSARWTTGLAIVLVLIGVGAAGAAGVLAMRSSAPEPVASPAQATAAPSAATPSQPAEAVAEAPAEPAQPAPDKESVAVASARSQASSQPAAPSAGAASAPKNTVAIASPPSNVNPSTPAPTATTAAPAHTAKTGPAPSSSVPPGLQFLKRNL
jgi:hypothetical protein